MVPTKYLLNGMSERENTYTLKIIDNTHISNYREKEQQTYGQTDTEKMSKKSCQTGENSLGLKRKHGGAINEAPRQAQRE